MRFRLAAFFLVGDGRKAGSWAGGRTADKRGRGERKGEGEGEGEFLHELLLTSPVRLTLTFRLSRGKTFCSYWYSFFFFFFVTSATPDLTA